jgi:hypothetical protein
MARTDPVKRAGFDASSPTHACVAVVAPSPRRCEDAPLTEFAEDDAGEEVISGF